jgi:hypothetical protein
MAELIHLKAQERFGPWPADPENRCADREGLIPLAVLEHRRWCAWTRAEGFEYSGDTAGSTRNDPAKRHNLLVGFHSLPPADQEAGIRMTERNISEYSRLMK